MLCFFDTILLCMGNKKKAILLVIREVESLLCLTVFSFAVYV